MAERLRKAAAEGRLLTEELEHRLGAAFSARTYGELEPLVADLPRDVVARRKSSGMIVPKPAAAIGILFLMPIAVAVVISMIVLLASMFALWAVFAVVMMWMFGRRPAFPGRYYVRGGGRACGRSYHSHAQRWRV